MSKLLYESGYEERRDSPNIRRFEESKVELLRHRLDLSNKNGILSSNVVNHNTDELEFRGDLRKVIKFQAGNLVIPTRLLDGSVPYIEMCVSHINEDYKITNGSSYTFIFYPDYSRAIPDYVLYVPEFSEIIFKPMSMRNVSITFNNISHRNYDLHAYIEDGLFASPNHGLQTGDLVSVGQIIRDVTVVDIDHFTVDFPLVQTNFVVESFVYRFNALVDSLI